MGNSKLTNYCTLRYWQNSEVCLRRQVISSRDILVHMICKCDVTCKLKKICLWRHSSMSFWNKLKYLKNEKKENCKIIDHPNDAFCVGIKSQWKKTLSCARWFDICISKYLSIAQSLNSCLHCYEINYDCMTEQLNTLICIFWIISAQLNVFFHCDFSGCAVATPNWLIYHLDLTSLPSLCQAFLYDKISRIRLLFWFP